MIMYIILFVWCFLGVLCLIHDCMNSGLDIKVGTMFFFILVSFVGPFIGLKNAFFKITKIDPDKVLIKSKKEVIR